MADQFSQWPPPGGPCRPDDGSQGHQQPDSGAALPPASQRPALPPAHPGELALPPPHPGELALPPGPPPLALPPPHTSQPSAWSMPGVPALSSSQPSYAPPVTPGERSFPPGQSRPPAPTQPSVIKRPWAQITIMLSLLLVVVCVVPLWVFGFWSWWSGQSHQAPPVLAQLQVDGQRADQALWSPDGRYLVEQATLPGAVQNDPNGSAVILWNVSARQEVRRFTGADGGLAPAWASSGAWLATTDGSHILIWQTQQIETPGGSVSPVARLNAHQAGHPITALAWSKDGQTLAAADEGGLDVFQAAPGSTTWKQLHYLSDSLCASFTCNRALSWSPDGRWLLVAPWHDRKAASGIGVLDAQTWKQTTLLSASAPLAWSPDGSLVLVRAGDETTLQALHAGSWGVSWTINPNHDLRQGYSVFPQAAGWSSDGKWLAGSADGWVDLWPTDTRDSFWVWNEQHTDQSVYTATSLAWSPTAKTLAVTTDGSASVTLYDLSNPSPPL